MEDLQSYNFNVKSSLGNYDVNFIDNLNESLVSVLAHGDIAIIDKNVYEKFGNELSSLDADQVIVLEATEKQKSYSELIPVIDQVIKKGFRKNNRLIAIGGGIIQDVTAFISSILYRGVGWIFYPTTLLAQGDSCIGSKTSINFFEYKNQLGNFYPPKAIYVYVDFVDSLSEKEILSGIGEMCHYYLVSGRTDFEFFRSAYQDRSQLMKIISRSLEIKKSYVERDEFDQGPRQVFNYGHTFGHAIESLTNYKVPHGLAVSRGMDMANFVSLKKGYISKELFFEIHALLHSIWRQVEFGQIDQSKLLDAMKKDKKNKDNLLGLILTSGIGDMYKDFTEPTQEFQTWLSEYFELTEEGLIAQDKINI